jgi:hypothetical protein
VVDKDIPTSTVLALNGVENTATFDVRWQSGSPDVKDFKIMASEDNGEFVSWKDWTPLTTDRYTGRPGHAYRFYSRARDQAGNVETGPYTATSTSVDPRVSVDPAEAKLKLALEGARPNPARGGLRVWFTLPSREAATLEVLDLLGRRLVSRQVGSLGPGRRSVDLGASARWRPGIYFIRLAQGGRVLHTRAALLR